MKSGSFGWDEIKRLHQRVIDAIMAKSETDFAALYTRDAEIYPPDGTKIRGTDEIARFFKSWFDNGFCGQRAEATSLIVGDDIAVETGLAVGIMASGAGTTEACSNYMIVHQRQADGSWLMSRDIWTAVPQGMDGPDDGY
ncbi:MAG: SgcJ/EcaC family oxidoreductase [Sphingomonadaceae bacterium]